ncbi:MAG TPA: YdaS family helix-turn-helix protein [Longimicrobiales bacterium]
MATAPSTKSDATLVARAIAVVGGQSALARTLGVSPVTVWRWTQAPDRLDDVTRFALRALVRYPTLARGSE